MRDTFKMIALLLIAVGAILAYAFIPDSVAENMPFKQLGMEALMNKDNTVSGAAEDSVINEPTDTATQRVLIFGDSMSEYLAYRLSDYTNKNGHSLTCVTWCGSGTRNWAETDTLNHYIRTVNPTHVFVCLGSNELYTADMKGCEKRIRAILAKIGNIPTVWIGPPNWCEDKGYNKLLSEVMGTNRYYPSYKLTFERQKDGRHPTRAASAMWMDKIIEWMNTGHSVHPFRMEKPDKRDLHYRQVTILPPGAKHKSEAGDSLDVQEKPVSDEPMEEATPEAETPATASPATPSSNPVVRKDTLKV